MPTPKLLYCPSCGGEGRLHIESAYNFDTARTHCRVECRCGVSSMFGRDEDEASRLWNNMPRVFDENDAYADGFIAGLREYAWWKDGQQWVGSCGTTLVEAETTANNMLAARATVALADRRQAHVDQGHDKLVRKFDSAIRALVNLSAMLNDGRGWSSNPRHDSNR